MCPVDDEPHTPYQEGEIDDDGNIVWFNRCTKCKARV